MQGPGSLLLSFFAEFGYTEKQFYGRCVPAASKRLPSVARTTSGFSDLREKTTCSPTTLGFTQHGSTVPGLGSLWAAKVSSPKHPGPCSRHGARKRKLAGQEGFFEELWLACKSLFTLNTRGL